MSRGSRSSSTPPPISTTRLSAASYAHAAVAPTRPRPPSARKSAGGAGFITRSPLASPRSALRYALSSATSAAMRSTVESMPPSCSILGPATLSASANGDVCACCPARFCPARFCPARFCAGRFCAARFCFAGFSFAGFSFAPFCFARFCAAGFCPTAGVVITLTSATHDTNNRPHLRDQAMLVPIPLTSVPRRAVARWRPAANTCRCDGGRACRR